MTENNVKESFKNITGIDDDNKASEFLKNAKNVILTVTRRDEMINELYSYQLKLAICYFNKHGNEGLSSYSEGGENESYLKEEEILSGINQYRLSPLARRMLNEKKKSKEIQP